MTSRAGAAAFFTEAAEKVSSEAPDLPALIGIAEAHGLSVAIPAP